MRTYETNTIGMIILTSCKPRRMLIDNACRQSDTWNRAMKISIEAAMCITSWFAVKSVGITKRRAIKSIATDTFHASPIWKAAFAVWRRWLKSSAQ